MHLKATSEEPSKNIIGMPVILSLNSHKEKNRYLRDLFDKTYQKDVIKRNRIANNEYAAHTARYRMIRHDIACAKNEKKPRAEQLRPNFHSKTEGETQKRV